MRSKNRRGGGEEVLLVADGAFLEPEQMREPRLDEPALLRVGEVLLDGGAELLAGGRRRSSSSTIPARLRTISASAQKATPSP